MSEPDANALSDLPAATPASKSRASLPLIWLIPLLAIAIGGWLAWKTISEKGPLISVSFSTGDGLEAGKTKVKYKSVELGVVEGVELADDRSNVIARIRMKKSATPHLVEDSRFWIVRPHVSGTSIEGLGTLLSGAYIGMDVGKSSTRKTMYRGLERPPIVAIDRPGRYFRLHAEELGSLDTGSPLYYRRLQVGQVVSHQMNKDGKGLEIRVFVNAPFDRFVTSQTRFWEASGISVELSATGARLETQSLNSILAGGIAFQARSDDGEPVQDDATFVLFKRREAALAFEDLEVIRLRMQFNESVRGLSIGAPVDFRGMTIGEVKSISADLDAKTRQVRMDVGVDLYPERFRRLRPEKNARIYDPKELLDLLVAGGVRGQLRTGSLVSGQVYVAIDFFPDTPKRTITWAQSPPVFPTVAGTFAELEGSVNALARKLSRVPFEELASDIRRTLNSIDGAVKEAKTLVNAVRTETVKDVGMTLADLRKVLATSEAAVTKADGVLGKADRVLSEDSTLQTELRESLREVGRAAASLRVLLDTIEQRPEAFLRGKREDNQ